MTQSEPGIILITGIMASGKSTVAQRLAERLPRSVHLRGDLFRRMIVGGRVDMGPSPSDAAFTQLRLRYELSATVADRYCAAGFTVVYQDVIIGPMLQEVVDHLKENRPLYIVVLCPSPDVVAQREANRGKVGYSGWSPHDLDRELRANTPRLGLWLDTSNLTVDETVAALLTRLEEAAV
jgi:predicted kinase